MKRRPRICYSETQKALMWERWKQGARLHEIGKLLIDPIPRFTEYLPRQADFVRHNDLGDRKR